MFTSPFPGMDPYLEDAAEWAIPLRSPFADVPLNLQAAFADTYKRGRYAEDIDYADSPPSPILRPADTLWVKAQIGAWRENDDTR